MKELRVYTISDGNCESADKLARLALDNFENRKFKVKNFAYISDIDELEDILETIPSENSLVLHSFLEICFLERVKEFSRDYSIKEIDILNPIIGIVENILEEKPSRNPELNRKLDKKYFNRMSAIEFAVKYDDGNNSRAILEADLVLIGVSRTSKTPLSIYLANKNNIRVTNVPLVPEIEVPRELFEIPSKKIIGLTNSIKKLNEIRQERLKTMGFSEDAHYTSMHRIIEELDYAEKIMKRLSCPVIDVSNKSIEESATVVMNIIKERKF